MLSKYIISQISLKFNVLAESQVSILAIQNHFRENIDTEKKERGEKKKKSDHYPTESVDNEVSSLDCASC